MNLPDRKEDVYKRQGFYCTEHLELAKEWACTENTDGYVNKYEIDTADLSVINLSSSEYTILHWLALLMKYRKFRVSTPVMKRGADWLKEHFLIDLTSYDAVVGYRADDSYFSFARAFVNNEISLTQLSYACLLYTSYFIRYDSHFVTGFRKGSHISYRL